MEEKGQHKINEHTGQARAQKSILRAFSFISIVIFIYVLLRSKFFLSDNEKYESKSDLLTSVCPYAEIVRPISYYQDNKTLIKILNDEEFRKASAKKLSGAVRIKTDVFDDSPLVEDDPNFWEKKFSPFYEFLANSFPLLWQHATVERVNEWGLVITWKGEDESSEPILLAAHQDVVPTQDATIKDWTYPPYEGVYDGKSLWGRGSADCKNLLIGLLEAAEELIKDGFKPKRTIIYGFGFDEEIGGERGAKSIGNFLLERYGKNSFYAVIDEGGQSIVEQEGVVLALPGTGEKGLLNLIVGLNTPGGHSSVPPDHTSIGIMAKLINRIESNPFPPIFSPLNPTFHEYQCVAIHSKSLDLKTKTAILRSGYDNKSNEIAVDYLTKSKTTRALIGTTQAVDIVHGGAKSNALPEYVEIVVNHRIAIESTVNATLAKDLANILFIAKKHNLGVIYDGTEIKRKTKNGFFTVKIDWPLSPAPLTPINDEHWKLLAGTIRHVYEEVARDSMPKKFKDKKVVVAPGIATGNTDTQHYWDLTDHIYRYRPGLVATVDTNAHGVDEHIPFDSHLQIIAFYYEFLQVIDSA
ncbi:uncharacterized protein PRCAT00006203001 [Priceomyces carsonii]|uniref:uncharacterized protein n=1 Tax=Priceomyces carsonii TaxID=28549 RepID=UPI002EDB6DEA|nr:unnamed protein product [Priceomyces carsonii]